jgi:hypothetical protein
VIERRIVTVMTGLCAGFWVYYFSDSFGASTTLRALSVPVGIALALATWRRYAGGHRTEVADAEDVPRWERILISSGMALAGFIGGFGAPYRFAKLLSSEPHWTLTVPLGLSAACLLGWIAWRHPTLFYKNRGF